jgi:predicted SprT family Zn-dependent metalloprotease
MTPMTVKEFFRKYPISSEKFAKLMLGRSKSYIVNKNFGASRWKDEDLKILNEAISELSYQLSVTIVHNELTYQAKCKLCKKEFTAEDTGERHKFYNENGLHCEPCRKLINSKKFLLPEHDPKLPWWERWPKKKQLEQKESLI